MAESERVRERERVRENVALNQLIKIDTFAIVFKPPVSNQPEREQETIGKNYKNRMSECVIFRTLWQ